jgi:hypothetical protein
LRDQSDVLALLPYVCHRGKMENICSQQVFLGLTRSAPHAACRMGDGVAHNLAINEP